VARIIVSKDKALVHGDVLVDDKPEIKGALTPAWHHVIFDQPYNRQIGGIRMTWENWRNVLLAYKIYNFQY
jgi:5'-nucleotidase